MAAIVPALKLPLPSRATIAEGVLALAAEVAVLLTFPGVAIVASLVSAIPALALISALTMAPLAIIALVTVPAGIPFIKSSTVMRLFLLEAAVSLMSTIGRLSPDAGVVSASRFKILRSAITLIQGCRCHQGAQQLAQR